MSTEQDEVKQPLMLPMPVLQGVSLRQGRPEDLPSVERLSWAVDYLMGGDYMPGMWSYMLNHPKWLVFVAVIDGEVVSTSCLRMFQGGKRAAGVGGKTHPSIRGTGVFAALRLYMVSVTIAENPGMEFITGVTPFIQLFHDAKVSGSPMWNFRDVGRRHQWLIKVPISGVITATDRLQDKGITTRGLRRLAERELKAVFRDDRSREALFPSGFFQIGAENYEAHEDVTDAVFTGYRSVYVRAEKTTTSPTASLCFLASLRCPVGTGVYLDCYGAAETREVLQHVRLAFDLAKEEHRKFGGVAFFLMGFPITCDIENLTQKIAKLELGLPDTHSKVQEVMLTNYSSGLSSITDMGDVKDMTSKL